MIKIRRNCFETNSSSTHSISIERFSNSNFKYIDIPKNKDIYIDETEFNNNGSNVTEWTKLNALIDFVIGYYDKTDIFKKYYDNVVISVDTKKPLFDIIKKLIKNECNSEIIFSFYDSYEYQTDDYEKNSLWILSLLDESTEEYIYDRFKEIIFDPEINFKHGKNKY